MASYACWNWLATLSDEEEESNADLPDAQTGFAGRCVCGEAVSSGGGGAKRDLNQRLRCH